MRMRGAKEILCSPPRVWAESKDKLAGNGCSLVNRRQKRRRCALTHPPSLDFFAGHVGMAGFRFSARAENRSDDRGCIHRLLRRISLFFRSRDRHGMISNASLARHTIRESEKRFTDWAPSLRRWDEGVKAKGFRLAPQLATKLQRSGQDSIQVLLQRDPLRR